MPGGEITPEKLIVIGEVARGFDLYRKITGGQRIDLLGARVDQLPEMWGRWSPPASRAATPRKALRTVKCCVGSTWCRSASRTHGARDPGRGSLPGPARAAQAQSAVSGCVRECAEAQSKDFGIIATENSWNL